jgi:hypothetical protein
MPSILVKSISLFCAILFGGLGLFYGFASYEWICEYHRMTKLTGNTCDIHHGLIVFVAVFFFVLSIISYREFNLKQVFLQQG